MKDIKNISNNSTLKIVEFGGIDLRDTHKNPCGTTSLVNFRVGADGSLERRDGTRLIAITPSAIRAVWTGLLWGSYRCIVLAGDTVYQINYETGALASIINVFSSEGDAELFFYRGELYVVDGTGLYMIRQNSLSYPYGYVPLIGKDWRDNELGEIYQPRNLLNNKGRFTYVISSDVIPVLRLDEHISRVDAMYINGELVDPERYSIGTVVPYVTVSGLEEGDRVSLYVTYPSGFERLNSLKSCTRAYVFGGINNSRPFLFGGSDRSLLFNSKYVVDSDIEEAREVYPNADALYFPVGYEFSVGDGNAQIATLSRHYDRLLIFTDGGVWQADSSACGIEDFPVMNINVAVNVCAPYGAALLGNSPCAVGTDAIYRFTAETDELNDCNAYGISEAIDPMLSDEFLRCAAVHADRWRGELLFSAPNVYDGIFVYSERTRKWTVFKGITAQGFFDGKADIGFFCDNKIYVFDKLWDTDSGSGIISEFIGNIAEFDTCDTKHLSSAEINYDGGVLDFSLCLDGESNAAVMLSLNAARGHSMKKTRISSRRFKYLVPALRCFGTCRKIHSLTINVR